MRALFLFLKFLYSKKFIKLLLIPILLLMFWAFSSVLFVYPAVSAYPASFSFITNYYDKSDIQNFSTKKVLKGGKITGYIKASNDNFGILVIRFNRSKPVQYQKGSQGPKEADELLQKSKHHWIKIMRNNKK